MLAPWTRGARRAVLEQVRSEAETPACFKIGVLGFYDRIYDGDNGAFVVVHLDEFEGEF